MTDAISVNDCEMEDSRMDVSTTAPASACPSEPGAPTPAPAPERLQRGPVRFVETVNVFHFARRAIYDRFPRDGPSLPLGMSRTHFLEEELPLCTKPKDTRAKMLNNRSEQRQQLLQAGIDLDVSSEQIADLLEGLTDDLKDIWKSFFTVRTGCRCVGACHPETCECLQDNVGCCHQLMPAGRMGCACCYGECPNIDKTLAGLNKRVEDHYKKTFARLAEEKAKDGKRDNVRTEDSQSMEE